ncbi:MAG: hypothetical protein Kow0065_20160 [Methylomicrobium sp.]
MFWNIFKKKAIPEADRSFEIDNEAPTPKEKNKAKNTIAAPKPVNIPVALLKRLLPLSQLLNEDEIRGLSVRTKHFSPGELIFVRGTETDSLVYLLKGTIYLEATNGFGQEIVENTFKALFPVSSGDIHQLTAIAKSNVTVIYLPQSILSPGRTPINPLNQAFNASETLQKNPFYSHFYTHFQQGELKIPSFPDVAFKLRRAAMQDIGIAEAVKIVNMDPVIAAKLIQIVNSPLYRTVNPITTCHDAVNRLGLKTTMHLVTAISLKNLAKSGKPAIKKRMQETWLQSIKVSSISYALAKMTRQINPEEALLAGLLHNIGVLPLLMFGDQLQENDFTLADIEQCIRELQGQIGSVILEKWDFPDSFKKIPLRVSNWFDSDAEQLELSDVVLLAKFHHHLTQPDAANLPLINTLPAFQKLDNQLLTPEMSLQILQDAKQQINETMKFFMV